MFTLVTIILHSLLFVTLAIAGSITITTTTEQDAMLSREGVKRGQTATQVVQSEVSAVLSQMQRQARKHEAEELTTGLEGKSNSVRDQVRELLGLPSRQQ